MRKIAGIFGVAGLLMCLAAVSFADPPAKDKPDDSKGKLAEDIFAKADKHNHGYINKYEFKKADADLVSAITQMATDGTIGRLKPGQGRANAASGPSASGTSTFVKGFDSADTDHDKKVTLAEFTDYAARAVSAADQELRAAAAQAAATRGPGSYGGGGGGHGRR
jgi:hypothetical protein